MCSYIDMQTLWAAITTLTTDLLLLTSGSIHA